MSYVFIGYLIVISILGFIVCAADKRAAVKGRRRVRESTLFVLAFIGGAIGVWLSMLTFRHKTRKAKFMILMPLLALVQAVLAVWLLCR